VFPNGCVPWEKTVRDLIRWTIYFVTVGLGCQWPERAAARSLTHGKHGIDRSSYGSCNKIPGHRMRFLAGSISESCAHKSNAEKTRIGSERRSWHAYRHDRCPVSHSSCTLCPCTYVTYVSITQRTSQSIKPLLATSSALAESGVCVTRPNPHGLAPGTCSKLARSPLSSSLLRE
jgi:hypothetical protein